ncbi:PqiC family protein [Pseudomonas sp. RTC3]|uniref:PqiC family protein n=1 Tax=unclassified Pseudomonas TaxID=196821 RepID=UPI002AB35AB9|nr:MULTISPECIES: PqiC family protein [unclassified Pseudomonas]MEB0060737.1 PqiC family protein [Pseudomonas sp. RTC3]MDY7564617.1 PqiC family protein [Pseudomonas sp. 5C2]MEB0006691.1 PqiC family protein [Pseudomonas sp. RTB2]MEB0016029.1 PqiC family protein [Pseudomonas sp. RTB3]MEB0026005.1 PqiC family protein [Pseudomonas sp. MH9.2]
MKLSSIALLASLIAAALSGCGSAPKEHFYTLRAVAERDPAASNTAYSVNVGPVTVPELVERQQLVLTRNDNQVEILEQTRWAASLQSIIGHVIASNLTQLTGNPRMAVYSPDTTVDADYHVAVDVLRFESVLGTAASLDARWTIRTADEQVLKSGRTIISEPTRGQDLTALLAAHDRLLATLSRDIAHVLINRKPSR